MDDDRTTKTEMADATETTQTTETKTEEEVKEEPEKEDKNVRSDEQVKQEDVNLGEEKAEEDEEVVFNFDAWRLLDSAVAADPDEEPAVMEGGEPEPAEETAVGPGDSLAMTMPFSEENQRIGRIWRSWGDQVGRLDRYQYYQAPVRNNPSAWVASAVRRIVDDMNVAAGYPDFGSKGKGKKGDDRYKGKGSSHTQFQIL
eukprot:s1761_g12.t1